MKLKNVLMILSSLFTLGYFTKRISDKNTLIEDLKYDLRLKSRKVAEAETAKKNRIESETKSRLLKEAKEKAFKEEMRASPFYGADFYPDVISFITRPAVGEDWEIEFRRGNLLVRVLDVYHNKIVMEDVFKSRIWCFFLTKTEEESDDKLRVKLEILSDQIRDYQDEIKYIGHAQNRSDEDNGENNVAVS